MKANKFLSFFTAVAMALSMITIPVTSSAADYTEKEPVTQEDRLYYKARDLKQTVDPPVESVGRTVKYHFGPGDGTSDLGSLQCIGWKSGSAPENAELTFEFEALADGVYSMRSVMIDVFNKQMGTYELFINGQKYDMKAEDGEDETKHTSRGLGCAAVIVDDITLNSGTNTFNIKMLSGASTNPGWRTLFVYDMEFMKTNGKPTETETPDPTSTPTEAEPTQTPTARPASDKEVKTAEKLYYEAYALADVSIPTYTGNTVTYHKGPKDEIATIQNEDGTPLEILGWKQGQAAPNAELTIKFDAVEAGSYDMRSIMIDVFSRWLGKYELYINDKKYEMRAEDGEADGEFTALPDRTQVSPNPSHTSRGISCAAVVANWVELNEGENTLRLKAVAPSDLDANLWALFIYDLEFTNLKGAPTPVPTTAPLMIQGENIPGAEQFEDASANGGYTGGKKDSDTPVEFTFDFAAPANGDYSFEIKTANGTSAEVYVNDAEVTGNTVNLNVGKNSLTVKSAGDSAPYSLNIDYILFVYDSNDDAALRTITLEGENVTNVQHTNGDAITEGTGKAFQNYNTAASAMKSGEASCGKYLTLDAYKDNLPVYINYAFEVEVEGDYEVIVNKGDDDDVNNTIGLITIDDALTYEQEMARDSSDWTATGDRFEWSEPKLQLRMKQTVHLDKGSHNVKITVDRMAAGRTGTTAHFVLDKIDFVKTISGGDLDGAVMYTDKYMINMGAEEQLRFKDKSGIPFSIDNVDSITYESTDTDIAKVSEDGVVTGVNAGECEITAQVTLGDTTKELSANVIINGTTGFVADRIERTDNGVRITFVSPLDDEEFSIISAASGMEEGVKTSHKGTGIKDIKTKGNIYETVDIPIDGSSAGDIVEVFVWDGLNTMTPIYSKIIAD